MCIGIIGAESGTSALVVDVLRKAVRRKLRSRLSGDPLRMVEILYMEESTDIVRRTLVGG